MLSFFSTAGNAGEVFGLKLLNDKCLNGDIFVFDLKLLNVKCLNFSQQVMLAQQLGTENYFAVKCLRKDVVLEDNDVGCTLIERKVLTLGTKNHYLCQLFCTFQTVVSRKLIFILILCYATWVKK